MPLSMKRAEAITTILKDQGFDCNHLNRTVVDYFQSCTKESARPNRFIIKHLQNELNLEFDDATSISLDKKDIVKIWNNDQVDLDSVSRNNNTELRAKYIFNLNEKQGNMTVNIDYHAPKDTLILSLNFQR